MRWALLAVLAIVSLACFGYPMYVIRPFRAQGADELALALQVKEWGPLVSLVAAVVAALVAWPMQRRWVAWPLAVLAIAGAGLARFNVYEKMFHRIDDPAFQQIAEAKVADKDMVLAIRVAGGAAAFPIRMMGYHHIANVMMGTVPVVATY